MIRIIKEDSMTTLLIIVALLIGPGLIKDGNIDGNFVNMTIAEFLKYTEARLNVEEKTIMMEGEDYLLYEVYEGDELLYTVEPYEYLVYRIEVFSSIFHTKKGIRTGNTLGDLREAYTISVITAEGRGVNVFVEEEPVIFVLDDSDMSPEWFERDKDDWEDELKIILLRLV